MMFRILQPLQMLSKVLLINQRHLLNIMLDPLRVIFQRLQLIMKDIRLNPTPELMNSILRILVIMFQPLIDLTWLRIQVIMTEE